MPSEPGILFLPQHEGVLTAYWQGAGQGYWHDQICVLQNTGYSIRSLGREDKEARGHFGKQGLGAGRRSRAEVEGGAGAAAPSPAS